MHRPVALIPKPPLSNWVTWPRGAVEPQAILGDGVSFHRAIRAALYKDAIRGSSPRERAFFCTHLTLCGFKYKKPSLFTPETRRKRFSSLLKCAVAATLIAIDSVCSSFSKWPLGSHSLSAERLATFHCLNSALEDSSRSLPGTCSPRSILTNMFF